MHRDRNMILDVFRDPKTSCLPDELVALILDIAGMANIGRRISVFSIFFPRLVTRKKNAKRVES